LDHHYRLCPGSVLVSLSYDLWEEVVVVEMETLRVFRGHGRDLWEVVMVVQTGVESSHDRCL